MEQTQILNQITGTDTSIVLRKSKSTPGRNTDVFKYWNYNDYSSGGMRLSSGHITTVHAIDDYVTGSHVGCSIIGREITLVSHYSFDVIVALKVQCHI